MTQLALFGPAKTVQAKPKLSFKARMRRRIAERSQQFKAGIAKLLLNPLDSIARPRYPQPFQPAPGSLLETATPPLPKKRAAAAPSTGERAAAAALTAA